MKITAHVMVKNEYQFLWYSLMSVINHVDTVFLWDTGSTDGTLKIIAELLKTPEAKNKVVFEKHPIQPFDEEMMRHQMLQKTSTEWFIVVDGDEIWWNDSIASITHFIRNEGKNYECIVVPTINTVGDIFHYQEKEAGNYHLAGRVGHYNLRAVNRSIPGLCSKGKHGVWGWADEEGKQIQERDKKKIKYLETPYLHCTFLPRASSKTSEREVLKRKMKLKHEIGLEFAKDFFYPEVFFQKRPDIVPSVWRSMSQSFLLRASIETPMRRLKRRYLPKKVGY